MSQFIWIIIVFVLGVLLPIQAGMNTRMGESAESPAYASTLSFLVGTIGLILYLLVTRQSVSWTGIRDAPPYLWIAGIMGAVYVTVIIYAFPKLGPGLTFGLVVAGQMVMSVVLEHFDVLVEEQSSVNAMKIFGIALIIVGVVIIREN